MVLVSILLLVLLIVFLIDKYSKERFSNIDNGNFKEIQIDCDWTKSTKDKYFYLLKK